MVIDKKALKKAFIRARNKRDFLLFSHKRARDQEQQRIQQEQEAQQHARRASAEATPDTVVWSAKTQDIRNRMTGKKRQAKERWNRFAGTASGGGRGL